MASNNPSKAFEILLTDAAQRDLPTARRLELFNILHSERYLTREQLIARVEGKLGAGCFGKAAWDDVFYRDLRVVKAALAAAGYVLKYSRGRTANKRCGYYLEGQPPLSETLSNLIRQAIAELDHQQINVFRSLSPSERVRLGCSVTDTAVQAVTYRIRKRQPELTLTQARYLAIQGTHSI